MVSSSSSPDFADSDVDALCETYQAYATVGLEIARGPGCFVVRNDLAPDVYDANFLWVGPEAEFESAIAFHEAQLGDRGYRNIRTQPSSPPEFEATFVLRDYVLDPTLQLLLDGPLGGPEPHDFDIRAVTSDADWIELARLLREDHVETNEKRGRTIFRPELSTQIVSNHRRTAPEVQFFLARIEDEAVAFFSAWPGRNGVGMVEDLFTHSSYRRQGIARALIHHCVADARARGADRVLIGAEPGDTPKDLYAAMGFEPRCMTRAWLRPPSIGR